MANHVPGTGAIDAAGGLIVLEGKESDVLIKPVLDAAGSLQFFNVETTATRREKYTMLVDVDEPAGVSEPTGTDTTGTIATGASRYKVGGFELGAATLHIADLGEIIAFSDDLLEDAGEDPTGLVNDAVIRRFARVFDRNVVKPGLFDQSILGDVTQTVYMDPTRADRLDYAVSQAMGMVEDAGANPTRFLGATDLRAEVREAGNANDEAARIYGQGGRDPFHGLAPSFSSNLVRLNAAGGDEEDVIGVVGDPTFGRVKVRRDVEVSRSDQATVTINGELVSLWEHGMTGLRWKMRAGAVILEPRAFCLIKRGPKPA